MAKIIRTGLLVVYDVLEYILGQVEGVEEGKAISVEEILWIRGRKRKN